MTKRIRLLSRVHGVDLRQTLWATADGKSWPVYNVSNLDTDYQNLVLAAPLMMRVIDHTIPVLETLVEVFEKNNLERYVQPLMQIEAGLNVAMIAALEGMHKVSK
jgi:hypothetical protein